MARSGGAWSVKGIDQATRDIAKRAAQASGLTIGEWIDRAILQDARNKGLPVAPTPEADRSTSADPQGGGGVSPDVMAELHRRLDESDARIDAALRPIAYTLHDLAVRLVEAEQAARSRATPKRTLAAPEPEAAPEAAPVAAPVATSFEAYTEPGADDHETVGNPVGPEDALAFEEARDPASVADDLPPLPESPPPDWSPDEDLRLDIPSPPSSKFQGPELTPEAAPEDTPEVASDGIGDAAGGPEGPAAPPTAPLIAAKARARPAPHPPRYDFSLDAEGLPDPEAGFETPETQDPETQDPETQHPEPENREFPDREPEHPEPEPADNLWMSVGARPDPVPPRGDLTPDDLTQGRETLEDPRDRETPPGDSGIAIADTPVPIAGIPDTSAPGFEAPGFETAEEPEQARSYIVRRRMAALLAAAVLLLGTLAGAWWFGGGGRVTDPDQMLADMGQRLGQAKTSVSDATAEAWHRAEEAVAGLISSENAPDSSDSAQSGATVESSDTPLPPLETAVEPAAPASGPRPEPETAEPAAPPVERLAEAPPVGSPPVDAPPVGAPPVDAPPVDAPPVDAPPVSTPSAEIPAVGGPTAEPTPPVRAPAVIGDPKSVMPPPAPAPAPPVETLAQIPPPPAPTVGPSPAASSGKASPSASASTPPVADDQSVPAAPVGTAGTPEEAEVQDVTAALQDKTAALPPEAPAVPTAELQARAVAGDPRAQNELASRLIAADPPNVEEAANWFREAAIQGVPGAQYNLGVLYERGLGVREDETRALLWYHSAAEQGHPLAQYNLGILYAAGRAVPLSYSEAAVWFERAAERGVPAAAYNLAVLLEGGLGRQRDMDQAMAYYERAKELGHRGAAQRLAGETPTSAGDGLLDLAETTSNSGTVGGREIAEIQQHLSDIGFYTGIVDGIAGPQTRSAISRYQASEELPVTGLPSSGLLRHLKGNT